MGMIFYYSLTVPFLIYHSTGPKSLYLATPLANWYYLFYVYDYLLTYMHPIQCYFVSCVHKYKMSFVRNVNNKQYK